jgi:DNA modification methylase
LITWNLEKRSLKDLKDYSKNPRTLSVDQEAHLRTSLEKFGVIDKIIVNTDNTIIGGHQRKRTLKKIGLKEVECYVPDRTLTEKEVEELNIRLNKNTGDWDFDVLANQWNIPDLVEWGFSLDDFQIDIEQVEGEEEEESELLEPPKDPKTQLGNIYVLGDHRLMCGDSTNPDMVKALLDGNQPILMVTDPPYGVNYDPSWRKVAGKGQRAAGKVQNDGQINWSLAWHLFPGSVAYIWHAGKYAGEVDKSLDEAEFEIISQIIWVKQHFALSRGDYHWKHEPCWYAVKKGCEHNWQGSRKECTVWEIANLNAFGGEKTEDERTAHSTQKPLKCMSIPIQNNSVAGEGVYDPFCGSGTTLIAAEQLKRKAFCMELDPAYCDIIVDRWVKYRNKNGLDSTVKVL